MSGTRNCKNEPVKRDSEYPPGGKSVWAQSLK